MDWRRGSNGRLPVLQVYPVPPKDRQREREREKRIKERRKGGREEGRKAGKQANGTIHDKILNITNHQAN
jgi:hypothetical protein